MSCKCAKPDGEGRFDCSVSGSGCMFLIPSSKACAELFGEGPDAEVVEPELYSEIKNKCLTCKHDKDYFDCSQCNNFDEWEE